MTEYLVIYRQGDRPDDFMIAEGEKDRDALLKFMKKHHWNVRRVAKIIPEVPR